MTSLRFRFLRHQHLNIDYQKDTHFSELKESELLRERLGTLREMDEYVGKYFSAEWLRKNVLMQSEEDIKMIDDQIAGEGEESEDDDSDLDVEN